MADPKAFELTAEFGSRSPYRILVDGGIVLHLEVGENALDMVTALYKASKGKSLRLLIEVVEPTQYGARPTFVPGRPAKEDESM